MDAILGSHLIKKNPNEPYKKSCSAEEDTKVLDYQRINFIFNEETFLAFKKRDLDGNVDIPASTAFAGFTIGDSLEIGIETNEKNQGAGFGSIVCAELIDDALLIACAFTSSFRRYYFCTLKA
ncbi:hypothetical protein [Paenibacillus sp. 1-18]|uniref:hypothetical protein n=1 Tax=Paenibacillus sp. 1-18 TaxID=1333846 RepID=UPI0004706C50|nr:hypothetical protein [Paenibacillus sp. 1-18]